MNHLIRITILIMYICYIFSIFTNRNETFFHIKCTQSDQEKIKTGFWNGKLARLKGNRIYISISFKSKTI